MSKPEFHVTSPDGSTLITEDFTEAAGHALAIALCRGETITIDVVIWDEEAADRWGGSDAVEQYLEDPETSVFERIEVKANSLGRIP
jgi:hypothetical protein